MSIAMHAATPTPVAPQGLTEDCDNPSANLRSLPTATPELCRDACQQEAKCQAFVFISGWKRCFLKGQTGRNVTVKMYSGFKEGAVGETKERSDNSGKDFKRVVVNHQDKCWQACQDQAECMGYTFIAGYDTCWLKKTKGKLYPKVFYCGTQPPTSP
jgi:hypothetical protein